MADTQGRLNDQISDIPSADRYVFVDSENVASVWLNLLEWEKVRTDDAEEDSTDPFFIVFYTENTPHLTFDDGLRIAEHREEFAAIKCFTGEKSASALDFQLVSLAGYLIQEYPEADYWILSNDKGYDPMIEFWKQEGIGITRIATSDIRRPLNRVIRNVLTPEPAPGQEVFSSRARPRFVCPICQSRFEHIEYLEKIGHGDNLKCPNCGFKTSEDDWMQKYSEYYFPTVNSDDSKAENDIIEHDDILEAIPDNSNPYVMPVTMPEAEPEPAQPVAKEKQKLSKEEFVKKLMPGENKNTINMVKKLLDKGNPDKINEFYKSVINQFGQKKGLKVYHVIKPKLAEYKKL